MLGRLSQFGDIIGDVGDPVRSALQHGVAVCVHHAGDSGCPAGVDDIRRIGRRGCVVIWPEVLDAPVHDEDRVIQQQVGTRCVGDGGVSIQRGHAVNLVHRTVGADNRDRQVDLLGPETVASGEVLADLLDEVAGVVFDLAADGADEVEVVVGVGEFPPHGGVVGSEARLPANPRSANSDSER